MLGYPIPKKPWESNAVIGTTEQFGTDNNNPPLPPRETNPSISTPYSNIPTNYQNYTPYNNYYGSYAVNSPYSYSPYNSFNSYQYGRPQISSNNPGLVALEQVVNSFTQVTHMIDSTVHATYSSFLTIFGVVDQINGLKIHFSQILGMASFFGYLKRFFSRKTGPEQRNDFVKEFSKGRSPGSKIVILFLVMLVALPYLLTKAANHLRKNHIKSPSDYSFAKALYNYSPASESDIPLKVGDIVAILDENTSAGKGWAVGRSQDGKMGYFPLNYVEVVKRPSKNKE
ncbi:hypothetical protein O9G_001718 [Rozella allomycis CSF55]|uniref:SH3 domain-containing protein n=1 Tax=Rozella allomycis (strain CSF55) TaxID=988480 RepID=A0A075ASP5_ROZAC|nr:hypothetical protein O9G_001718 [Rozella allomycis CSF55]|eukprot:EPZ33306.1 hypothetical protein O9G_001718 [Rozella allomycis CSF55]